MPVRYDVVEAIAVHVGRRHEARSDLHGKALHGLEPVEERLVLVDGPVGVRDLRLARLSEGSDDGAANADAAVGLGLVGLFVGRDEEDVVGVGVRVEGSHGAVLQGALTGVVGGRERHNTLHVQRRDLQFNDFIPETIH